jgi:hypothetical protein
VVSHRAAARLATPRTGHAGGMFVWHKRSGERSRVRFYWWPLVLSLALSVVLTIILNKLI